MIHMTTKYGFFSDTSYIPSDTAEEKTKKKINNDGSMMCFKAGSGNKTGKVLPFSLAA